jgi:L-ascorbate metabolism protein UlaG (beta-lactamase superfamily)
MTGKEVRRPRNMIVFPRVPAGGFESPGNHALRATWLGHSTVLIEIDGRRYLTDPIWSRRCSPVPLAGPSRFFDVPVALEDIPHLDGVIISHDHYDHLDEATIRKLAGRDIIFHVPLGVERHLVRWGISADRIREFDWWDELDLGGGHRLIAAPARHFSGRGPLQKDKTLWASWIIVGPRHRVYFGGDGGYQPAFRTIGDAYGPFDITMLEIGAYHPNWGDIHLGPEMALRAHRDLRGRSLLQIHWGTFQLALHTWTEPVEQVRSGSKEMGIRLLLPEPGQPVDGEGGSVDSGWWVKI